MDDASDDTLMVRYINLQRSFETMMTQYRELEREVTKKQMEINRLTHVVHMQRDELTTQYDIISNIKEMQCEEK
jgi:hypothetical protein